jgi:hypothetical protein
MLRRRAASYDDSVVIEEEHLGAPEETHREVARLLVDDHVAKIGLELEHALCGPARGAEAHEESLGTGNMQGAIVGDEAARRRTRGAAQLDVAVVREREHLAGASKRDVEAPAFVFGDASGLGVVEDVLGQDGAARKGEHPELVAIRVGDDGARAVPAREECATEDRRGCLDGEYRRARVEIGGRPVPRRTLDSDRYVGHEAFGENVR